MCLSGTWRVVTWFLSGLRYTNWKSCLPFPLFLSWEVGARGDPAEKRFGLISTCAYCQVSVEAGLPLLSLYFILVVIITPYEVIILFYKLASDPPRNDLQLPNFHTKLSSRSNLITAQRKTSIVVIPNNNPLIGSQ